LICIRLNLEETSRHIDDAQVFDKQVFCAKIKSGQNKAALITKPMRQVAQIRPKRVAIVSFRNDIVFDESF